MLSSYNRPCVVPGVDGISNYQLEPDQVEVDIVCKYRYMYGCTLFTSPFWWVLIYSLNCDSFYV